MPRSPAEKRSLMPRRTRQPRRERDESASAHRTHSHSEVSIDRDPDLIMLLSDPEVRLMMHADNVKESQLREMPEAVSVQIQTCRAAHDATYRPGVGIVLLNTGNQLLVGRRIDVEDAWQMPQGGIEPGETPREAALQELREEIGTNDVESSLKAAGGSITTCQRSSRERLGIVAGVDSDKNGWSCCLRVKTAQSMLRPLIRNSMPGAGCNRRNCPRSPSLSSVVSTSAFLQSFPRYSETRGLERYPERSPAIPTHRHGRSFIQNWAHLEI
jgi:hypothetical protein